AGFKLEVDAPHRRDRARGDAEVEREGGAELERRLEGSHLLGGDRDREEAASPEECDRQPEGVFPRAEAEAELERFPDEGHLQPRPEAQRLETEDAYWEVGKGEREAGLDPLLGDVEARRIGEPVERDERAQRLDEGEDALEGDVVEDDVDVRLLAGAREELDLLELERDESRA